MAAFPSPARRPVHPLETAFIVLTALHLCFLPWALGAMHAWTQIVSLGLSIAGLALALWPRFEESASPARLSATRLLRFPVFWAGVALLAYVAIQGCNPAWRFMSDSASWWLVPIGHISWLPSGVDAPFFRSNPWRALTIYASLWLLVCSVWVGLRRRRSWRTLFSILAGNGFLLALLGFLEQLSGARRIFWSYLPSNGSFVASFIYRNHAGAYFNLMVAIAAGLAWWHSRRARRRLESPGPTVIFTFFAFVAGVAVIFSYSRASIGLLLAFAIFMGGALAFRLFQRRGPAGSRADFFALILALAAGLGIVLVAMRTEKLWDRFAQMASDPAASDRGRFLVRQAAADMRRDRWLLGWGAGCFRYGFPLYAQSYPEIYYADGPRLRYWEHAHDDLLEFSVELGVAGLAPLAAIFAWGIWRLGRCRFWRHRFSLSAVAGSLLIVLHGRVDFVFQNPAVLFTWGVLLIGSIRWAELEAPVGHRTEN